MRRTFLSIIAMAAMLIPAFPVPAKSAAKKCPVKMPETLLSLYRQSDAIYIARYDKKEDGEVSREGDDYTVVNVKTSFDISSALKGEARKFFVLEDEEYRYHLPPETESETGEQAVFVEDFESFDPLAQPKPGDTVLLFLKKNEEGVELSLADYRDGMKKLSPEYLAVYVDRINELNSIFSAKKPDPAAIAEWLVRCAENPATRWEGTFELLRAFQRLDWQESRRQALQQKIERGEVINDDDDLEEEESSLYETTAYATALTDYQKGALSQILLNRDYQNAGSNGEKRNALVRGDRELIELVKRWVGDQMVSFLLEQLKSGAFAAPENAQLMDTVAEMIDDSQASSLAEKYSEISYQENDAVVGEEDQSESENTADESSPNDAVDEDVVDEPVVESEAETSAVKADKPEKQTYKDLRDELLAKFIARSEKVLSKQESLPTPTN